MASINFVIDQIKHRPQLALGHLPVHEVCGSLGMNWRQRTLDPATLVALFVKQIIHANSSCAQVRHLGDRKFSAQAYCQARQRLPLEVLQKLSRRLCDAARREVVCAASALFLTHRVFVVDGSSFSMPDTPQLQKEFGQSGAQKPGCGFPVAHLLALFDLSSGMLIEAIASPLRTHDLKHVAQLHPLLREGDLLLEKSKGSGAIPFGTRFAPMGECGALSRLRDGRSPRMMLFAMIDPDTPEVTADQLHGFKQLRRVAGLLSCLHDVGCERDGAGNRELHFDDYVLLILLYLFNPLIDSMRTLQRVSQLPEVQKRLGIKRFALGSFSESCRVFDPAMLQEVVEELAAGLLPIERKALFKQLPGKLTLVDSTVIQTLCSVAQAMFLPLGDGRHTHAWRLHVQFDVDHHVPAAWEVTTPRNTGKSDEKNVLRRKLSAGHTYVMDRWYAQFTLWNDIKAAASSYVCRVRDNSVYEVIEERPLDQAAIDAGVISDQVVEIGLSKKPHQRADHPTRLICVTCTPHQKRGARRNGQSHGPTSDGTLRIVTDLLDVPAHVIAFLYEYRWTIEVFFRFFKQILGCRHLLSTRIEGVQIQIYAAVICCLMLNTLTGKKPTKWHVTLMALYLQGLASDDDVLKELNKPDRAGVKLAAREAYFKSIGL